MLMSPADEAWVKELYEANALKLYKVAFRRLGDKDEAENVVQEAFLLLLARFDTVRVHPNPSGWLMKVVQNLIRHSMDRNQKQSSHEISIEEQITQISPPIHEDNKFEYSNCNSGKSPSALGRKCSIIAESNVILSPQ